MIQTNTYLIIIFLNHFTINKIAIHDKITEFNVAEFATQIVAKRTVDVSTDQKNDHIVEKNNSFHIFSQVLSPLKISDNSGIV